MKLDSVLVLIHAMLPYLNPRSVKYKSNCLGSSKTPLKSSSSNRESSTLWVWPRGGMRVPGDRRAWGPLPMPSTLSRFGRACPFQGSAEELGTGLTPWPRGSWKPCKRDKFGKDVTKPPREGHNDRGVAQCQAQFWLLRWIVAEAELLAASRTKNLKLSHLKMPLLRVLCRHPLCCLRGCLNCWNYVHTYMLV